MHCCSTARLLWMRSTKTGEWPLGGPTKTACWLVCGVLTWLGLQAYYSSSINFFFRKTFFFCKSMNTPVWMSLQRTLALLLLFCQCSASTSQDEETAVFAAGCFWSVELVFDRVEGVKETR